VTPLGLRHEVNVTRSKAPLVDGGLVPSQWTETVTSNGRTSTVTYTRSPRQVTSTSPEGRVSTSLLDAFGRVTETRIEGLESVYSAYDARGRLSTVRQGTGEAERVTTYGYDGSGYIESVTDALQRTVRYERDASGRVTKQILPDLREISFGYDANGNITSVTPPSRPAHQSAYLPADLLERYTPPAVDPGGPTRYEYNLDHQVTRVVRPDARTIDVAYDGAGRVGAMSGPESSTSYGYDPVTGHLRTVTSGIERVTYAQDGPLMTRIDVSGSVAGAIEYGYDRGADDSSNFEVTSRTIDGDVASRVDYAYDDDGLPTRAGALQFEYEAANGMLRGTTLHETSDSYTRNAFGEVTQYTSRFGTKAILEQSLVRDRAGRIATKTETLRDPLGSGETSHTYAYGYDTAGRLVSVTRDGAAWESYAYDPNGNRTSATGPGSSAGTATYDDQDRLLTYGSKAFTYTANGELLTASSGGQAVSYTCDVFGNLRRVVLADSVTIDYLIDPQNRRIGKKVEGTLAKGFLYGPGSAPLAELAPSGAVKSVFIYGTRINVPDVMVQGAATYRIVSDLQGSVRWVVNANTGAVMQRLDYDTFGRVTLDTNPGFQPFGFAGGLYDPQTGLTRFGARDYDAETGRWAAKDPLGFAGGDSNLYGYVIADPVNLTDPSGLLGLADLPNVPQGVTDFYAGIGDNLLLGFGDELRSVFGVEGVDRCSGEYSAGEWTGVGVSVVLGGVQGIKAAGTKGVGREFSHWIADRVLKRTGSRWIRNTFGRSLFNGNYVTPFRHFLHDPYRFLKGYETLGERLPALLRQLDRVPRLYYGAGVGAAVGGTAAANNKPSCECAN
jgi:RHS repeat-associated protein